MKIEDVLFVLVKVFHLGTIGGVSVSECTRRTMKYSLTNKLAILFNWTGQGGKKAFGSSRLLSVIRIRFA
jgi:hypothetical protein